MSSRPVSGLIARAIVSARSAAEIPVETPSRASMETVNAVWWRVQAHQAARVADHEVHRLGRRELRGDDEIALVFAVLVIDEDEHPPCPRLGDEVLGRGDVFAQGARQKLVHGYSARRAT
jgi:hypothetical protein